MEKKEITIQDWEGTFNTVADSIVNDSKNKDIHIKELRDIVWKLLDKAMEEGQFTKEELERISNRFGLCCEDRGYYEGDRDLENKIDKLLKE